MPTEDIGESEWAHSSDDRRATRPRRSTVKAQAAKFRYRRGSLILAMIAMIQANPKNTAPMQAKMPQMMPIQA
jgi:hypothetical protein